MGFSPSLLNHEIETIKALEEYKVWFQMLTPVTYLGVIGYTIEEKNYSEDTFQWDKEL